MKMWDAAELVRRMKMITSDEQLNEVYQTWPKDERDFLEHLTQEDNPVLVVATLKEFENAKEKSLTSGDSAPSTGLLLFPGSSSL